MTDFYKKPSAVAFFLFVALYSSTLFAQDPQVARMTTSGMGYLEYLPADYNTSGKLYPVLIFLHGSGERGSGSPADLEKLKVHGPPMHLKKGHNMCFTVNGKSECFIVLSPQINGWSFRGAITPFIQYALQKYRIDPNRVCVTGLSMGGEGTWYTASGTDNTPNYLAAIAPMAGKASLADGVAVANRKIAVWAFHGDADKSNSLASALLPITGMQLVFANPAPILTIIPGGDHYAGWERGYRTDHSIANPNVYEWLLTQKRLSSTGACPTVNAGGNKTITLPVSTATLKATATDTDGTITAYSWTKASGPGATLSGTNTPNLTISNAVEGTYVFHIMVTDNQGLKALDEISLIVNKGTGNSTPTVSAGVDKTITLPVSSTTFTATGLDAEGAVSYTWTKTSGPAVTLGGAATSTLSVSNLIEGTYVFRATVKDSGGLTAYDEVTLTVLSAAKNPPTVSAGADKTITLPTSSASFTASANKSGGTITKYQWTKLSGPSATLGSQTGATLNISNAVEGTFVFRITVTDSDGLTGSDDVSLIVKKATNIAPTVNAGSDKTIVLPTSSTTFTATASDTDGTISKYQWTKVSGPSATIGSQTGATLPISNAVEGTFVFRITVTDNGGLTASDDVTLIVKKATGTNTPPVADAGEDVSYIFPIGKVTIKCVATDPGGQVKTYSWTKVSGPTVTLSGTTAANLSVMNPPLGVYVFGVTVTDNLGLTAYDEVKLTVKTANAAPTISAGADISITLPVAVATLKASASDDGQIKTYAWTKISGPTAVLGGATTGTLSLSALLQGTYVFRVTVTDDGGLTAYDEVKVTVNPVVNAAPPQINPLTNVTVQLPANTASIKSTATDPGGQVTTYLWTKISGPTVTTSGSNTATLSLSKLLEGTYIFRLTVTDNGGLTATQDVKVVVLPAVNQPPLLEAGDKQIITLPVNTATFTAVASDPDGTIVSYAWKKIGGCDVTLGATDGPTLVVTNAIECTYVFRVEVTDDDGLKTADTVRLKVYGLPAAAPVTMSMEEVPTALGQNYPNPFVTSTVIPFTLEKAQHVELKIFDGTGNELGTLLSEDLEAGEHEAALEASALGGNNQVRSGMYYYKLITREKVITKRMVKRD